MEGTKTGFEDIKIPGQGLWQERDRWQTGWKMTVGAAW